MKTGILVVFACCFALALAEVGQECKRTDDCGEGECCLRISTFLPAKCKKLREKDEFCFPRDDWNKEENTYRFMCPCVEGFTCIAEKVEEEDGVTIFKQAKCVEK